MLQEICKKIYTDIGYTVGHKTRNMCYRTQDRKMPQISLNKQLIISSYYIILSCLTVSNVKAVSLRPLYHINLT